MTRGHLLYQDFTEPIYPIEPSSEEVLVDKWFQPRDNPVLRKTLSAAILAGSFFFFNPESLEAAGKVPDWHPQTNQPQRLVTALPRQHTGEFRFEVPRTILLSDWFQETRQPYFTKRREVNTGEYRFEQPREVLLSDWWQQNSIPYFSKRRDYHTGESRFEVPRTVLLSDWFQPAQEPYFEKRRDYHTGESRFEVPRDILLSDWFTQYFLPTRAKERQLPGGARPEFVEAAPEEVTLDKWFRPASEPYFPKLRFSETGEFRFEVPREILLSDWWQAASEPVRRIIQRLQSQFTKGEIIAEDTQLNEWWQPASEPYFSKRRNYFTGEFRFEVPREILITDWFQPAGEPHFSKLRNYFTGELRFETPREILLNDWFQEVKQPYFSKRRLLPSGEYRFEVPREVLISDWFQPVSQSFKKEIITPGSIVRPEQEIVVVAETFLDWFRQASEPYFKKFRFYSTGEFRFETPPALVFDWLQAISQPYFTKYRSQVQNRFEPLQQILFDWWQQASEPVRRRVIRQTAGEARTDFIVITLDRWFRETSRPHFIKRRLVLGEFKLEFRQLFVEWFREIVQPYFTENRDYLAGQYRVDPLPRPPLITHWFQQLPIQKPFIYQVGGETRIDIIVPEVITLDKWFMAVVQPHVRRITPVGAHELKIEIKVSGEFIQAIFM